MSDKTVSADRINEAPIEQGGASAVPVQSDPLQPDPIIGQKLGLVGKVFGYGEEKKGNLAAVVIVFCMLVITYCGIAMSVIENPEKTNHLQVLLTAFLSFFAAAIGYVTGRKPD